MRFMVRVQDNPDLPDYLEPLALFRFQVTPDDLITDRFDRERDMWVDWPDMLGFTGIGGAENYAEVREEEANQLIQKWGADIQADQGELPAEEGEAVEGGDEDVAAALYGDLVVSEATPEEVQASIVAEQDEAKRLGDMGLDELAAETEREAEEENQSFGEIGERGFNLSGSLRRLTEDDDEEDEENDY
jgi:hypothetical protein